MPGGGAGDALDVLRAAEQSGTGSMISDVAENAEWMAKRLVWIPSDKNGYEAASIKQDLDDDKWVEIRLFIHCCETNSHQNCWFN